MAPVASTKRSNVQPTGSLLALPPLICQTLMTAFQVHQGDGRLPLSPSPLARSGERATVAPRGRLELIPKARVGFPAEVCESE